MDQYRGYAVLGMFVVNFLGHYDSIHHSVQHNDDHFNWADSIMPAFIFAAGFSYRLSMLKRVPRIGRQKTRRGFIKRSFALILVSLLMYGFNGEISHWADMNPAGIGQFIAKELKASLWEVLAIIGVCQLLILPVMEASAKVRLATAVGFSLLHVVLSGWFNYAFVSGQYNWLDEALGILSKTAWDGGFFGLLSWSIPMLAGTLVYDLMASRTERAAIMPLLGAGGLLMGTGYLLSCMTTLYDIRDTNKVEVSIPFDEEASKADEAFLKNNKPKKESTEEEKQEYAAVKLRNDLRNRGKDHAASPVIPPFANMEGRSLTSLLAEPPFVPPPGREERKLNYWMMTKRITTQSFILFATGFSCAVYALFIFLVDLNGFSSKLFAMFGENPLAAYIIHHAVNHFVSQIFPEDSPAWYACIGLVVFTAITWLCVRYLQKNRMILRL